MGWINSISNGIEKVFKFVRPALQSIPPILLLCEVFQRPGLSAIATISSVIKRLPEANIETGVNECGAPNVPNKLIRIICEEVVKEIKDNAKITCVIPSTTISSTGTGANAGGPLVINSYNIIPSTTNGITE